MPKPKQTKTCMVPTCNAISADVPDRIFFVVPEKKKKKWLKKVGGNITSITPDQRLFCCEKHFNVKKDIVGYDFYKVFGGMIKLEDHAYPYKNLGDNIVVSPPKRQNIIAPIPKAKKKTFKQEPSVEQVDPIPTSEDKYYQDANDDESRSDVDDSYFDHVASGSDNNETKVDFSPVVQSEEIFVTSDVYMHDDEDDSDSDDVPLNMLQMKTVGYTIPDVQLFESNDVDSGNSNIIKYNCHICNKTLSSSRSLKRHIKTFHADHDNDKEHSCNECHEIFITLENYKKHMLVHKQLEFVCEKCSKSFSSTGSLKRHTLSCSNARNSDKKNDTALQAEIASQSETDDEGNDKEISCRVCKSSFTSRDDYLKHKIIHKKTFECDVCQKVFRTRLHLKVHFPMHMEIKPFLCEICSRSFARANNLKRHRLTHVTDKKFCCDICGARYAANYLLKKHMQRHINSKTPRRRIKQKGASDCDDCKITLNSPYRLNLHRLRLHNPENPFKCDTCQQRFTTEILMSKHVMRSHAPDCEYIFKCVMCPKKYTEEAALKRHLKLHTDVKKTVTCHLCDKTLGRPNRLLPHMRALHNPENPFKCAVCQQTFREEKILDNHIIQVHEQTIQCEFCARSYSDQRWLREHIRKFHLNSKSNQSE